MKVKKKGSIEKDNEQSIRRACARFVDLCREMNLLNTAIDGSTLKR